MNTVTHLHAEPHFINPGLNTEPESSIMGPRRFLILAVCAAGAWLVVIGFVDVAIRVGAAAIDVASRFWAWV